jgi:hypothetical protein
MTDVNEKKLEIQRAIKTLEVIGLCCESDMKFLEAYLCELDNPGVYQFDPEKNEDDFVMQKIIEKANRFIKAILAVN